MNKERTFEYKQISDELNRNIGFFFKFHRKKMNITGRELSKKLQVSQQQISRYECGSSQLNLVTAIRLCHYLNIDVYTFCEFVSNLKYKFK